MDCSKVQEILSAGVDRELMLDQNLDQNDESNSFADQQLAFDDHVENCALCAARMRGLDNIKSLVRHHEAAVSVPEDLRSRVLALIENEASGEGDQSGAGREATGREATAREAADRDSSTANVVSFTERAAELKQRSRPLRRGSLWSSVAAAVLVVVALGYFLLPQALVHAQMVEKALRTHHDGPGGRPQDVTFSSEGAGEFCASVFGRAMVLPSFDGAEVELQGCREDRFGDYKAAHLLYTLDGTQFSLFVMDNPKVVLGDSEEMPAMADEVCQCQNGKDYMVRCCHIGDTYICVVVRPESESKIGELLTTSIRAFKKEN